MNIIHTVSSCGLLEVRLALLAATFSFCSANVCAKSNSSLVGKIGESKTRDRGIPTTWEFDKCPMIDSQQNNEFIDLLGSINTPDIVAPTKTNKIDLSEVQSLKINDQSTAVIQQPH